jgi:hypothetical protein
MAAIRSPSDASSVVTGQDDYESNTIKPVVKFGKKINNYG